MNLMSIKCKEVVKGDMVVLEQGQFACIKNNPETGYMFLINDNKEGYVYPYRVHHHVVVIEMPIP